MSFKDVCDVIMRLYLYADQAKVIHYTTDSSHCHKLCDEVRDSILDFVDKLAESYFGYYGKGKYTDFTLDLDIIKENDISKLCQHVLDIVEPVRTNCLKNDKLSGFVSLIDDFKTSMSKMAFLGTFDKVSSYSMKK